MRRFIPLIVISALVGLLSGCGPIDKINYTYVPPHDKADRHCVARCMYAKSSCQRICQLKNARSCNCVISFNTCYSACGGDVIEHHSY